VLAQDVALHGDRVLTLDANASPIRHPWAASGRLLVLEHPSAAAAAREIPILVPYLPSDCDGCRTAPASLQVDGDRVYVAAARVLAIYDLSGADAPRLLGMYGTPERELRVDDFVAAGSMVCTISRGYRSRLVVLDVSDPTRVVEVGAWRAAGLQLLYLEALAVIGRQAYVLSTMGSAGPTSLAVFDLTDPRQPALAAEIPLGETATDIAAADGYVVVGTQSGLTILTAADPAHPSVVASLAFGAVDRVTVRGSIVYAAGDEALKMVDVSTPTAPRLVATAPVYAAGVAIADDVLYVAGGTRGLLRMRRPGAIQ